MADSPLTHFHQDGSARMVNVSQKPITLRTARAEGRVIMRPETLELIRNQSISKGDVLAVARLAGIMGAKRTSELIPLCHSLGIDSVELQFEVLEPDQVRIESVVQVQARTGVEMEALTSVSVAALTIYDMCKSVDREIRISDIQLLEKSGGKQDYARHQE